MSVALHSETSLKSAWKEVCKISIRSSRSGSVPRREYKISDNAIQYFEWKEILQNRLNFPNWGSLDTNWKYAYFTSHIKCSLDQCCFCRSPSTDRAKSCSGSAFLTIELGNGEDSDIPIRCPKMPQSPSRCFSTRAVHRKPSNARRAGQASCRKTRWSSRRPSNLRWGISTFFHHWWFAKDSKTAS